MLDSAIGRPTSRTLDHVHHGAAMKRRRTSGGEATYYKKGRAGTCSQADIDVFVSSQSFSITLSPWTDTGVALYVAPLKVITHPAEHRSKNVTRLVRAEKHVDRTGALCILSEIEQSNWYMLEAVRSAFQFGHALVDDAEDRVTDTTRIGRPFHSLQDQNN